MAKYYDLSYRLESEMRIRDIGMLLDSKDQLICAMHNLADISGIDCTTSTPSQEIAFATEIEDGDYLDDMKALAGKIGKDGSFWYLNGTIYTDQDLYIVKLYSELNTRNPTTRIEVLES